MTYKNTIFQNNPNISETFVKLYGVFQKLDHLMKQIVNNDVPLSN